MDKKTKKSDIEKDAQYRGADINLADDCKVSKKLVKEDTKTLNNNPRNDDM